MKTKEQESVLLGLKEINESERNEVTGGVLYPQDIFGPIVKIPIFCCIDIPPARPIGDYI
jgi:hypothetical protein